MTTPINIQIRRRLGCEDIPLPTYMSAGAAGLDLRAACDGAVVLEPGDIKLIPCGFAMAIPPGYEAQVRPRSGLALKHGVILPNSPGTIDSDYRGEVGVIMGNMGRTIFVVRRGMRIAQMVIAEVIPAKFTEVRELAETVRGEGGFGHTGQ